MIALHFHVFAAVSAADLIVLDVRTDAYAALADAVVDRRNAHVLLAPNGVAIAVVAADVLLSSGLAATGAVSFSEPLAAPTRAISADLDGRIRPRIRDLIDLAAAAVCARRRLRRGLPCGEYLRERPGTRPGARDPRVAIDALRRARLFLPTPSRCLPASLVTAIFLRKRGIAAQIVFGVRTHPFAAHCWVEHEGCVLEDELDRVSAYVPICVGLP